MSRIGFEIPDTFAELVSLINRTGKWRLTLIDTAGHVIGHYQTDYGHFRESPFGDAVVYNGEIDDSGHPLFAAPSNEEATIFLSGIYLGLFGERRLEEIQDDLAGRPDRYL
jgi:hypothetical protein